MNFMAVADDSENAQAYELVLRHVENRILDHTLQVGDQLPPERELASQLQVSRAAVREAMRVLQTQGLITSNTGPGRGTRIAPTQGDALGRIFRLHLTLTTERLADVTETRVALERASAALAATNASETALSQLRAALAEMSQVSAVDAFNRLDTEFHVLIARSGNNQLIADLTIAIRQAAREPIRSASLRLADWPAFRASLDHDHHRILDAIAARTPDQASALMESHIRRAYSDLGLIDSSD